MSCFFSDQRLKFFFFFFFWSFNLSQFRSPRFDNFYLPFFYSIVYIFSIPRCAGKYYCSADKLSTVSNNVLIPFGAVIEEMTEEEEESGRSKVARIGRIGIFFFLPFLPFLSFFFFFTAPRHSDLISSLPNEQVYGATCSRTGRTIERGACSHRSSFDNQYF